MGADVPMLRDGWESGGKPLPERVEELEAKLEELEAKLEKVAKVVSNLMKAQADELLD